MFLLIPNIDFIRTTIGIISSRPIHILKINIIFAMGVISMDVIPVVSPTFPWAEHTSKITSPSVLVGNTVDITIIPIESNMTHMNEIMAASLIRSIASSLDNGFSPSL